MKLTEFRICCNYRVTDQKSQGVQVPTRVVQPPQRVKDHEFKIAESA